MLVSMSKIGQSHGSLLEALKNAKNVEKEKVLVFQKVLESIIRKAAEASINEIENKYIELEKEILQEKQDVKEKEDSLKKYEENLKNAMGNRAQYFVCTKLTEKQMFEADNQMFKQKLNYYKGIQLQFTPNQTLIDYVNGLNGIGEIAVTLKKKQDIYTVKEGRLIKSVSEDFSGANHVTFDTCRNKMYVSNWGGGIVCIDDVGNHLCSFTDSALRNLDGVCVDGRGNIFVVGHWSHNVVQFNEDGKMVGVVIKEQDGLYRPCSICFDPKLNRLFVAMVDNDVVKMYELE
ncbi:interferon-beta production [Mactra antiquata]